MSFKLVEIGRAALVAAAICAATAPSPSLAATAPDFVTNEALFWLDASALDAVAGTELDSWADVRGGSHPTVTTYKSIKPQVIEIADGALAGKKAVTFFTVGTQCDMKFSADQNIKTAFFVTDIDQSGDAYLLGSQGNMSHFYFARGAGGYGTAGSYQYVHQFLDGTEYWNDGVKVAAPTTTVIPTGYQLITWSRADGADVDCLCNDRNIPGRIGGKRLCEVIAFSRSLSDLERSCVEGYLKAKWWGGMSQKTATAAMRINKFGGLQVHFDASAESSFHYEVAGDETGTLVSQWDDLSGNGRHLVPYQFKTQAVKYATRGNMQGAPVLDTGTLGSGVDLKLPSRLATRTVFMVADIDRHKKAYWLGDASTYHFARNDTTDAGYYTHPNTPFNKNGGIYRNGRKITSPTTLYPDAPGGGLCVYTFIANEDCNWERLCRDRAFDGCDGGKRLAELITFANTLSDADREAVEQILMEKWRPSDAYVDALIASAPVHVDASSSANFNYTDGKITGWKNLGGGEDLVKPERLYTGMKESEFTAINFGGYGFTNGVPAFLMGAGDSRIDLAFTRLTNVRSVFWAMDVDRTSEAPFLGDGKTEIYSSNDNRTYHFCRGCQSFDMGTYFSSGYAASAVKCGPFFCDGTMVASTTTERPPFGLHVYDLTAQDDLTASSLSVDRWCPPRNGGRAISELLIFTNVVSGLTQDAIRERLARKWSTHCGWAGAGDAEWGAGKYRVFDSDAVVPADGAAAAGVGFTADATLSGGTLTLGDGGIFASEGTEVAVSAPVAGKLGVYGPGVVTLAVAPAEVDSLSVGYGSTLVLAAGETAISGGLSIQENGKLVLDVSALPAKQHASISFANCVLPAGGTLYDYVSLAGNTQEHMLTVSADGRTVHVNDPGVALSAEWNGGANDSATVAANWLCRNVNGETLPNTALPGVHTTNVVLNGDCDLRTWGTPVFADGVRIDLNGHALRVASLADDCFANATVTNSDDGVIAELHVDVASGSRIVNLSVSILGGVKLVKEGLGTYVAAKNGQGYTGGTTIREGVLEKGVLEKDLLENNVLDARNFQLGARGSTITVSTNGANRGVFDIKGMYAQSLGGAEYVLVMDGGLVRNTGNSVRQVDGQFFDVRLTADSEFSVTSNWGMFSARTARATVIDLGGYTLKIAIGAERIFHVVNSELKNGFIDITSGGSFQTGINGGADACLENVATNVDFRIGSAMKIYAPLSVRNYEQVYGDNNNDGTGVFSVHGTFKPAAHDYFYGVTLMDGSTIDLSQRTSALPLTSSFSGGRKTIDFAANAKVTVDLSGRADVPALAKSGDYVVTWTESTAPGADVTFRLDAATAAKYTLKADATGLRLGRGGFMLIVR